MVHAETPTCHSSINVDMSAPTHFASSLPQPSNQHKNAQESSKQQKLVVTAVAKSAADSLAKPPAVGTELNPKKLHFVHCCK